MCHLPDITYSIVRDVPYTQVKKEVSDYIIKNGKSYICDIVEALNLDIIFVSKAVSELEAEESIKGVI